MDAVKDGNGLGVDIHVFARGDGRERVDAGGRKKYVAGLPETSLRGASALTPPTVNWVYPCASTLTCAAREFFTVQLLRTPIVGLSLVTVKAWVKRCPLTCMVAVTMRVSELSFLSATTSSTTSSELAEAITSSVRKTR